MIVKILGHGAFRKRVMEMGFVKGRKITLVLNAPLQDPIKFHLMDYEVSLRKSEAQMIEIEPYEEWEKDIDEKIKVKPLDKNSEKTSKAKNHQHSSCGQSQLRKDLAVQYRIGGT